MPERGRLAPLLAVLLTTVCQPLTSEPLRAGESTSERWVLERFSEDVTILRTKIPIPASSAKAGVTLSCDGLAQRFQLTLPGKLGDALGAKEGSVLLGARGTLGDGQPALAARFKRPDAGTLFMAGRGDDADGGLVVAIARNLARHPEALELLIHPGNGLITLPDLRAVHLTLPADPQDAAALNGFLASCSRDARPREGRRSAQDGTSVHP